jgi:predicted phage tail protein
MSQAVTLKFHPTIQKYTNVKEHIVNVNDFVDIRNCLESLFPLLGIHIKRIRAGANRRENLALVNKNKRIIQQEEYFLNRLNRDDTEFYVVPLFIGGGGNGMGMIIIGIALVALVIVTGGTAAPVVAIFQGLQNTTNSNVPVPIIYGRTRIGGQFVSGEIRTIEHGRNEFIKVSALFPPGAN